MPENAFERFRRLRDLTTQEHTPSSVVQEAVPSRSGSDGSYGANLAAQPGSPNGGSVTDQNAYSPAPKKDCCGVADRSADVSVTSLSQRCPNPACMGIIEQANASVHTKLAGRLAANYSSLFASPAYHDLRGQLVAALTAGDLDATKAHCQRWCQVVIAWTAQQERRAQEQAAAIDGVVA